MANVIQLAPSVAVTTLASGISVGATSISITSATNWPPRGDFYVNCGGEVVKATAISGTTVTTTAWANTHSSGDTISVVLDINSILRMRSEANRVGLYSALPNPTTEAHQGDRYIATDSEYEFVHDGSAWQAFIEGNLPVTLPPTGAWTWDQQASSVLVTTYGSLDFEVVQGVGTFRIYYRAIPTPPYTLTMRVRAAGWMPTYNSIECNCQLMLGDSSAGIIGKFEYLSVGWDSGGTASTSVTKFNNNGSFNSNYSSASDSAAQGALASVLRYKYWHFQLYDDGTNVEWRIAHDGRKFQQMHQHSRTSFLTSPAYVGIGFYGANGGHRMQMKVVDWTVV